ncbi:MAG: hypothetical protein AVDCRST_MAG67-3670, partial [uncultured Solirubrobacteraceae bacterium]
GSCPGRRRRHRSRWPERGARTGAAIDRAAERRAADREPQSARYERPHDVLHRL